MNLEQPIASLSLRPSEASGGIWFTKPNNAHKPDFSTALEMTTMGRHAALEMTTFRWLCRVRDETSGSVEVLDEIEFEKTGASRLENEIENISNKQFTSPIRTEGFEQKSRSFEFEYELEFVFEISLSLSLLVVIAPNPPMCLVSARHEDFLHPEHEDFLHPERSRRVPF